MHIDVMRHLLAVHFRPEHRILEHQVLGHDAGLENFAPVIDVVDIVIDRLDALLEPGPQQVPFAGGKNARQHVERNEPLLRIGFAVDREGDADAAEQHLGLATPIVEDVRRHLAEPARQLAVGGAQRPVRAVHLVERDRHGCPGSRARPNAETARDAILAASSAPTQAVIRPRPQGPSWGPFAHVLSGG
jgi:hypothetical protein